MTKWRKFIMTSFLIGLGIVLLAGCQSKATNEPTTGTKKAETMQTTEEKIEKTTTPTLFLHGYGGTVNSFKGMIQRLEDSAQKELTLTVDVNGQVQADGELTKKADNPIVQVLFADNKNNEWNQTEWIKACLTYLQSTYGIDKVNIVGHSMGGVSGLRYLATYGQDQSLPQVQKFVALGAPFNEFEENSTQSLNDMLKNGPAVTTSRYQDYQQLIGNVPTTTQFLLVGGQLSETDASDGTVPLSSALAVYALLKQNENPVEEKVVEGENAAHSMLHENQEVDRLVQQFVWNPNE